MTGLNNKRNQIGHAPPPPLQALCSFLVQTLFLHFCPGTMTTDAESINSDLQRELDRRL